MRLVLIRHALTAGNEERRYVGRRTDEPLSARGRTQCRRFGAVELERVYASPLERAQQTARLCFPGARVVPVAGLEEMDFGAFEGRTADEMVDCAAYRAWVDGGCVGACPDGESQVSFARRSNAALAELLRACARREEQQVVVVVHGGTIMAALSELAYVDGRHAKSDPFAWHVGTCAGVAAEVRFRGETVELHDPKRFETLAQAFANA